MFNWHINTEYGYAHMIVKGLDNKEYKIKVSAEIENKQYIKEGQLVTLVCKRPVGSWGCYAKSLIAHDNGALSVGYDEIGESPKSDILGRLIIAGLVFAQINWYFTSSHQRNIFDAFSLELLDLMSINVYKYYSLAPILSYLIFVPLLAYLYKGIVFSLRKSKSIKNDDIHNLTSKHPDTNAYLYTSKGEPAVGNVPFQLNSQHHLNHGSISDDTELDALENNPEMNLSISDKLTSLENIPNTLEIHKIKPLYLDSIKSTLTKSYLPAFEEVIDLCKKYHSDSHQHQVDELKMVIRAAMIIERLVDSKVEKRTTSSTIRYETRYVDQYGIEYKRKYKDVDYYYHERKFKTNFTLAIVDMEGFKELITIPNAIGNDCQIGDILLLGESIQDEYSTLQFIQLVNLKLHFFPASSIKENPPEYGYFGYTFLVFLFNALLSLFESYQKLCFSLNSANKLFGVLALFTPFYIALLICCITFIRRKINWHNQINKMNYLFGFIKTIKKHKFNKLKNR